MAAYRAEGLTAAKVADDPTSVKVSFAAAPEPVTLVLDWRLASELIDRLAVVNNGIRHVLSAPDTRADRLRTGCHRTGLVLAVLALVPALWGLWTWIEGALDPDGWKIIVGSLVAGVAVYAVAWSIGWTVAAFVGTRERPQSR